MASTAKNSYFSRPYRPDQSHLLYPDGRSPFVLEGPMKKSWFPMWSSRGRRHDGRRPPLTVSGSDSGRSEMTSQAETLSSASSKFPSTPNLSFVFHRGNRKRPELDQTFRSRPRVEMPGKSTPELISNDGSRGLLPEDRTGRGEPIVYRGNIVRVQVPRYFFPIHDDDDAWKDGGRGTEGEETVSYEMDQPVRRSGRFGNVDDDFDDDGYDAFRWSKHRYHSDSNILGDNKYAERENEFMARNVVLTKKGGVFGFVLCGAKTNYRNVAGGRFASSRLFPALQYLERVEKGSAAAAAKLNVGDFILEVNGTDVTNATHERTVQLIKRSGDMLHLKVMTSTAVIPSSSSSSSSSSSTSTANRFHKNTWQTNQNSKFHNEKISDHEDSDEATIDSKLRGRQMAVRIVKESSIPGARMLGPSASIAPFNRTRQSITAKTPPLEGERTDRTATATAIGLLRYGAEKGGQLERRCSRTTMASPPPCLLYRVRRPDSEWQRPSNPFGQNNAGGETAVRDGGVSCSSSGGSLTDGLSYSTEDVATPQSSADSVGGGGGGGDRSKAKRSFGSAEQLLLLLDHRPRRLSQCTPNISFRSKYDGHFGHPPCPFPGRKFANEPKIGERKKTRQAGSLGNLFFGSGSGLEEEKEEETRWETSSSSSSSSSQTRTFSPEESCSVVEGGWFSNGPSTVLGRTSPSAMGESKRPSDESTAASISTGNTRRDEEAEEEEEADAWNSENRATPFNLPTDSEDGKYTKEAISSLPQLPAEQKRPSNSIKNNNNNNNNNNKATYGTQDAEYPISNRVISIGKEIRGKNSDADMKDGRQTVDAQRKKQPTDVQKKPGNANELHSIRPNIAVVNATQLANSNRTSGEKSADNGSGHSVHEETVSECQTLLKDTREIQAVGMHGTRTGPGNSGSAVFQEIPMVNKAQKMDASLKVSNAKESRMDFLEMAEAARKRYLEQRQRKINEQRNLPTASNQQPSRNAAAAATKTSTVRRRSCSREEKPVHGTNLPLKRRENERDSKKEFGRNGGKEHAFSSANSAIAAVIRGAANNQSLASGSTAGKAGRRGEVGSKEPLSDKQKALSSRTENGTVNKAETHETAAVPAAGGGIPLDLRAESIIIADDKMDAPRQITEERGVADDTLTREENGKERSTTVVVGDKPHARQEPAPFAFSNRKPAVARVKRLTQRFEKSTDPDPDPRQIRLTDPTSAGSVHQTSTSSERRKTKAENGRKEQKAEKNTSPAQPPQTTDGKAAACPPASQPRHATNALNPSCPKQDRYAQVRDNTSSGAVPFSVESSALQPPRQEDGIKHLVSVKCLKQNPPITTEGNSRGGNAHDGVFGPLIRALPGRALARPNNLVGAVQQRRKPAAARSCENLSEGAGETLVPSRLLADDTLIAYGPKNRPHEIEATQRNTRSSAQYPASSRTHLADDARQVRQHRRPSNGKLGREGGNRGTSLETADSVQTFISVSPQYINVGSVDAP